MASAFAVNLVELLGVSRGQGQHAFMVAREVQDSSQKVHADHAVADAVCAALTQRLHLGSLLPEFWLIITFKWTIFVSVAVILVTHVLGTLLYTFSY